MNAWTYPTAREALDAIAAIDAARGATEELRLPTGEIVTRPRKTWALPIPLKDGTFAVPHKPILDAVAGRAVTVRGTRVVVKSSAEARAVDRSERVDETEEATLITLGELAG